MDRQFHRLQTDIVFSRRNPKVTPRDGKRLWKARENILGDKNTSIAKQLCITKMAAYRSRKRYQKLSSVEDHPKGAKSRSVNSFRVRKMVKKRILRDSKKSMRKMASNLNISPASMRRIVKHKLGF
uniref:HTH_Tnp_Tc3_2 domain-containing protein n=1 Tax=Heterorhabditis bacteriophora TaxID=37862 RepID=A0A1I7X065_HETBA